MKTYKIKFEDLDYKSKRNIYREYSNKDEIKHCIETVADEIYNKFTNVPSNIDNFQIEWNQIVKYLTEGYIAFEIMYDDSFKNIIGLKELDPLTLVPSYEKGKMVWHQYSEHPTMKRLLYDGQVIMISYQDMNMNQSYVDSLIRPYNILKAMESLYVIGNSNIDSADVEYAESKFFISSRIPKMFRKFGIESIQPRVDARFEKFTNKHFENIYKIYDKIKDIQSKI